MRPQNRQDEGFQKGTSLGPAAGFPRNRTLSVAFAGLIGSLSHTLTEEVAFTSIPSLSLGPKPKELDLFVNNLLETNLPLLSRCLPQSF